VPAALARRSSPSTTTVSLLGLSVGLSEAVRAGFPSGARAAFGGAAPVCDHRRDSGALFAHPDKIRALLDASSHPFFGRPISMSVNYLAVCFLEYTTDPAIAILLSFSAFAVYSYRHKPGKKNSNFKNIQKKNQKKI